MTKLIIDAANDKIFLMFINKDNILIKLNMKIVKLIMKNCLSLLMNS